MSVLLVLEVLSHQTGLDRTGRQTVDLLATNLPKVAPGVSFEATTTTVAQTPNHDPFQRPDDRSGADYGCGLTSSELARDGVEILKTLHRMYPEPFYA